MENHPNGKCVSLRCEVGGDFAMILRKGDLDRHSLAPVLRRNLGSEEPGRRRHVYAHAAGVLPAPLVQPAMHSARMHTDAIAR